jgi:hypothetical protein
VTGRYGAMTLESIAPMGRGAMDGHKDTRDTLLMMWTPLTISAPDEAHSDQAAQASAEE